MTKAHLLTPEANLKRKRTLSEKLNDPDWTVSDAKRAVEEKRRRLQRKQKTAWLLQRSKGNPGP